jgi:predicted RNase H-like nuclease
MKLVAIVVLLVWTVPGYYREEAGRRQVTGGHDFTSASSYDHCMTAILGIDAAWTPGQPAGVALVERSAGDWHTVAVAPSYDAFIDLADGSEVDWRGSRPGGQWPPIGELLAAADRLCGGDVELVTVDMPIANEPVTSRREADRAVARAFGKRWCATHSPTPARPGKLGEYLMSVLREHGFPLVTAPQQLDVQRCSAEVYPHPALLALLGDEYRVPYKVSRSGRYWPGATVGERIGRLLGQMARIEEALDDRLGPTGIRLPRADRVPSLAHLKRYEDALDALVCAWVGACILDGRAQAFGDETAAIWIPN